MTTPDIEKLASIRVNLLDTKHGALDLLRSIGDGLDYPKLLGRTVMYGLDGLIVRAIDLETLMEAKAYADRPKDRLEIGALASVSWIMLDATPPEHTCLEPLATTRLLCSARRGWARSHISGGGWVGLSSHLLGGNARCRAIAPALRVIGWEEHKLSVLARQPSRLVRICRVLA